MRRVWQAMVDEPLILFAIIGGVLFAVHGLRKSDDLIENIEIRPTTIRALQTMQQDLAGRPLTDSERENLVQGLIEDEVLMREAFRRELEKKDSRVRKRLLSVMRSTLDQPVAAPTRAELEAYFREHQSRYLSGETITFDHVFLSFGSAQEPDDPAELLASLRAGADHMQLGEFEIFGRILRDRSQVELRRTLGDDFAKQVFALPLGQWHGPIDSRHGMHFVRVTDKRDPAAPSFEQLEEYLRQDWMFRKRRALQTAKIAEMQKRYRIVFLEE